MMVPNCVPIQSAVSGCYVTQHKLPTSLRCYVPCPDKWGFISTIPGSELKLKLDTTTPGGAPDALVRVELAILHSYEHMGQVSNLNLLQVHCGAGRQAWYSFRQCGWVIGSASGSIEPCAFTRCVAAPFKYL